MAANSPFGATATAAAPAGANMPQFQAPTAPPAAPAQPTAAAATPGLAFGGGDPFSAPSGISGEKITQFEGELLLVKPTELIPEMNTKRGTAKDVIRAHVVVLSGDRAGEVINDMLVFQTALRRELATRRAASVANPAAPPYLLGRLGRSAAKEGKDPAWIFVPFSDADYTVAKAWTDAHPGW